MATQTAACNPGAPETQLQTATTPVSRLMPVREVLEAIWPARRSSLYRWMKLEKDPFPGTISLGPLRSDGRASIAVWDREEVFAWLARQRAKPRTVSPKNEQVA